MKNLLVTVLVAGAAFVAAQQPVQIAKLNSDAQLTSIAVCNLGRELVGIDKEHKAHLWTLPIGTQRLIATSAEPWVTAACSPDGRIVVLATSNGKLTVVDTAKNQSTSPMTVAAHEFNYISISNQGLIAAAVADRPALLLRGTEKPLELPAEFGGPNAAVISSDGSLVAVADSDNKIRIYDSLGHLKSKDDVGPLEPFFVAFSPDNKSVYVTGADAIMRTVDVASGEVTRKSEKFGTAVLAMSMSPKGDQALVMMMDEYTMAPQSVAIWNANTNTAHKLEIDPKAFVGGGTGKTGWILVKQEEKAISLWELKE